jgi:Notch-like protein
MCQYGFNGTLCQNQIDLCKLLSPCQNGICVQNSPGYYQCQCLFGFTGTYCETLINVCASSPCSNNATCSQYSPGVYTCNFWNMILNNNFLQKIYYNLQVTVQ